MSLLGINHHLSFTDFSSLSSVLGNKTPLLVVLLLYKEDKNNTYLAQQTQWVCWNRENKRHGWRTLHIFIDLSLDAETRKWPSWEKLTLRTDAVWPFSTDDSPWLVGEKKQNPRHKTQLYWTDWNPIKPKVNTLASYANENQCIQL